MNILFQFRIIFSFEIDEMFIDLLSKYCEEEGGGGGGGDFSIG